MKNRAIAIIMFVVILADAAAFSQPARASVQSATAGTTGCVAAGLLTPLAEQGIQAALNALGNQVNNMASGLIKSGLGGLLGGLSSGGGVLGGPIPVQDSAVASTIGAYSQTATRNQIITRCLALEMMTNLTNNILLTIQTGGRDGGATFVQNWTNFQTGAQYRGENIFRAELSTANLCSYESAAVKAAYGVDPNKKIPIVGQNLRTDSLQPFSLLSNCTMPANFTPQAYQQNFTGLGGWDAFLQYLQGANNPIGLGMITADELAKQRAQQESSDINQVLANNGQTGISGKNAADSCQIMGPNGKCLTFKNIKTTGEYLSQSVGATIGSQFSWLTSAQGVGTIIDDFTQVLVNRLFDMGDTSTQPTSVGNDAYSPQPTQLIVPGVSTPVPSPNPDQGTSGSATPTPGSNAQCTSNTASLAQSAINVANDLNPGIGSTNTSGQATFQTTIGQANDVLTKLNLDGAVASLKLEQDFSTLVQAANDYFASANSPDLNVALGTQTQTLADAFVTARAQAVTTAGALIGTCSGQ